MRKTFPQETFEEYSVWQNDLKQQTDMHSCGVMVLKWVTERVGDNKRPDRIDLMTEHVTHYREDLMNEIGLEKYLESPLSRGALSRLEDVSIEHVDQAELATQSGFEALRVTRRALTESIRAIRDDLVEGIGVQKKFREALRGVNLEGDSIIEQVKNAKKENPAFSVAKLLLKSAEQADVLAKGYGLDFHVLDLVEGKMKEAFQIQNLVLKQIRFVEAHDAVIAAVEQIKNAENRFVEESKERELKVSREVFAPARELFWDIESLKEDTSDALRSFENYFDFNKGLLDGVQAKYRQPAQNDYLSLGTQKFGIENKLSMIIQKVKDNKLLVDPRLQDLLERTQKLPFSYAEEAKDLFLKGLEELDSDRLFEVKMGIAEIRDIYEKAHNLFSELSPVAATSILEFDPMSDLERAVSEMGEAPGVFDEDFEQAYEPDSVFTYLQQASEEFVQKIRDFQGNLTKSNGEVSSSEIEDILKNESVNLDSFSRESREILITGRELIQQFRDISSLRKGIEKKLESLGKGVPYDLQERVVNQVVSLIIDQFVSAFTYVAFPIEARKDEIEDAKGLMQEALRNSLQWVEQFNEIVSRSLSDQDVSMAQRIEELFIQAAETLNELAPNGMRLTTSKDRSNVSFKPGELTVLLEGQNELSEDDLRRTFVLEGRKVLTTLKEVKELRDQYGIDSPTFNDEAIDALRQKVLGKFEAFATFKENAFQELVVIKGFVLKFLEKLVRYKDESSVSLTSMKSDLSSSAVSTPRSASPAIYLGLPLNPSKLISMLEKLAAQMPGDEDWNELVESISGATFTEKGLAPSSLKLVESLNTLSEAVKLTKLLADFCKDKQIKDYGEKLTQQMERVYGFLRDDLGRILVDPGLSRDQRSALGMKVLSNLQQGLEFAREFSSRVEKLPKNKIKAAAEVVADRKEQPEGPKRTWEELTLLQNQLRPYLKERNSKHFSRAASIFEALGQVSFQVIKDPKNAEPMTARAKRAVQEFLDQTNESPPNTP
jgi:hypothetical protein